MKVKLWQRETPGAPKGDGAQLLLEKDMERAPGRDENVVLDDGVYVVVQVETDLNDDTIWVEVRAG